MTGPGGWCSPTQRGTSSVSDGVLLSGRQVRTNLSQLATSPVAQRDALYRCTARAVASVRCPRSSSGEVLSLRELPGERRLDPATQVRPMRQKRVLLCAGFRISIQRCPYVTASVPFGELIFCRGRRGSFLVSCGCAPVDISRI